VKPNTRHIRGDVFYRRNRGGGTFSIVKMWGAGGRFFIEKTFRG